MSVAEMQRCGSFQSKKSHSNLQLEILFYLHHRRTQRNIFAIQETRVQVSRTRYRVPDICVFVGPEPDEQIFTQPPFLCIDPQTRRAWIYRTEGMREVRDGVLRTENPDIEIPLEQMFSGIEATLDASSGIQWRRSAGEARTNAEADLARRFARSADWFPTDRS